MLFSCGNPDSVVQELASGDTLSGVVADSIVFYRSDSGVIQLKLTAPKALQEENNGEKGGMEFPQGFHAIFFDKESRPSSEINADYGKTAGNVIIAEGNVVVVNYGQNEKMSSDKLFWYQDTKMMYTRSHVLIVASDKEIEGDSLVAREDFSEYTIYNGRAVLDVDEEL